MCESTRINSRFCNIHHWTRFDPQDDQYCKYDTYVVLAGFEIFNVYETLCLARTSLEYIECSDFGQLISFNDDIHLAFIRKIFMQNSIMYYNICIDLAWQVLWLYYGESSLDLIYNDKCFNKTLNECSYEGVLLRITLAKQYKLKGVVEEFHRYLQNTGIREAYNYIKHRGTFHYNNLGTNYDNMMMRFNGIDMKILSRKEIDLDEWINRLVEFDNNFSTYFSYIIEYIMPKDYEEPINILSNRYIEYGLNVEKYLKEKNK